ncbi:MAG: hypothetical protein NZ561_05665 [Phycisphaerae bacterium]|nr:hypothetical protein [Phycisphaerae bacterium]MDW8261260.1 hypothetical protein [Phycisphaerales bacterium]
MPRRCFVAAALALTAGGAWGQTLVYSTSFEAPTFAPGVLAPAMGPGQGGWQVEYDDPSHVRVVSGIAVTGSQSVRFLANEEDSSGGWAWYDPLQINPIASGTPLVTVQFSMLLGGEAPFSDGWGLEVFSTTLNPMARMQVGPDDRLLVSNGGSFVNTGVSVSRGSWHRFRQVFDFISNRYDTFLNGTLVADDFVFDPDNGVIGDVDFRHFQPTPASDFACFDDFSVSVGGQLPSGAEWNLNSNGSWHVPGNWSTNFVPNGPSITAKLGTVISAPRQITLDAPVTLDQLQITSPVAYTLLGNPSAGSPALRFAGQLPVALQVAAGSHEFRAPLRFDKDATIGVFAGASLRLTRELQLTGRNLTKSGEGSLHLPLIRANSLTIEGGLVRLTGTGTLSGPMLVSDLAISAGTLDLSGHKLVIDYLAGLPASAVNNMLLNRRLIDSSINDPRLALGFADNSVMGLSQLEDLLLDDTALVARVTIKGDTNLDGSVNISDFSSLSVNFNRNGYWGTGDFNHNGTVELSDFAVLAAHFNLSESGSLLETDPASLPEPAAGLGMAGVLLLRARTFHRRNRNTLQGKKMRHKIRYWKSGADGRFSLTALPPGAILARPSRVA